MRFSKFLLVFALGLFVTLACSGGGGPTGPPPPTAPSKPTNVQVTPGQCGSGEVTISWTASRDAKGYHIYRDGADTNLITVTSTSWKDTGLTPGSSHTYQVDAFNDIGNSPKASVSATALGACPPTVSLSYNPPSVQEGSGTQVVVSVTTTNVNTCTLMPQGVLVGATFTVTPNTPPSTSYMVNCVGPGGQASATIAIPVTPAPTTPYLKVQVWAAAPGTQGAIPYGPVSGLSVTIRSGPWVSTTVMTVQGNMAWDSIPLPPSVQNLSGSVTVDATNVSQRTYIPSVTLIQNLSSAQNRQLRFVLTPMSWTLQSGTYSGTVVPIQIGKALLPAGDGSCYWCIDGPLDSAFVWQNYPVSVVFTDTMPSGRGTPPIPHTAADSVELSRQLDSMEQRYGENLFQLATWNGVANHGISIDFDYTLYYAGVGGSGGRNNYFFGGAISFRSGVVGPNGTIGAFSYTGLIEHEFGHTLGMGHTCSWLTIMFTNCELLAPPVLNRNSSIATPGDVAYFQVLRNVRTIQIAQSAQFGLSESLQGEQSVLGIVSVYSAPRSPSSASIRDSRQRVILNGVPALPEPNWK